MQPLTIIPTPIDETKGLYTTELGFWHLGFEQRSELWGQFVAQCFGCVNVLP
jgi:hypothetical protein